MLSSQFLGSEIDHALNEFRETHGGTLSGMTRFRDHLDDMPANGYAYSAIATDRIQSFLSLLFGHIANYQSHGTFNAPEQLGLYGDGGSRNVWTYSDSYRQMLGSTNTEVRHPKIMRDHCTLMFANSSGNCKPITIVAFYIWSSR
jgi:hypothetical protein